MLGVLIGYKLFVSPTESTKEWKLPDTSGKGVKFVTEESLLNDIKETNKIIPLELELSETIIVDNSWGDWDIFKKYKKITYTAACSYSMDLSILSSSNIEINSSKKEIDLKVPKPEVYSININHDKTIYQEAVTGLLRFGDLSLSSEEYGAIERELKSSIYNKMNESELYAKASESAKASMKTLLSSILGEDVNVNVEFI
ncbi:DUF4230 domain-containing protein [Clostridium paraputrificum]|uniref:DUF4230 domain-containing protein n=1 Tax=Clostridium TaxID=1485 RepID=UPI003D356FCF